jgi:hypothetical protein
MQIIGRSVACPAIWRAAAAGLPPFFSLTHRVHRFHDRFPADRGTSHAPTARFASDTDAGSGMNLWELARPRCGMSANIDGTDHPHREQARCSVDWRALEIPAEFNTLKEP